MNETVNRSFRTLREELAGSLLGLDERQTQLRPHGNVSKWSIQQIVGHLRLTYAATGMAMDARIAKASATKATPSLLQYAGQFTLITCGYFPRGRQAPERVIPTDEAPVSGVVLNKQLADSIAAMGQRVDEAEAIFGERLRGVTHMVLGPLSIGQWRRFHLIHGRHHIKQILAIRREYRL